MKIFADYHHGGLYASLIYLLEGRLGHTLLRPIGMDWFDKGYWKIAEPYGNNPDTARQYLAENSTPTDGTPPLNNKPVDAKYFSWINESSNNVWHRAVTLEQFLEIDPDVIIASIPAHIASFKKLIKDYNLRAKLVYHIGNIGWHTQIPWDQIDNLMASVKEFPIPAGKNAVFYRQEFDLEVFAGAPHQRSSIITSFVNLLPEAKRFRALKEAMPNYLFQAYGIGCPDGIVNKVSDVGRIMRKSDFGYHNKPQGDGFGHIIHNWFAVGKPVIVNMGDYKDKLAGELLVDGETCIDLDNKSAEDIAKLIYMMSDLEYFDMCRAVRARFAEAVDFGLDAAKVGDFLNDLM